LDQRARRTGRRVEVGTAADHPHLVIVEDDVAAGLDIVLKGDRLAVLEIRIAALNAEIEVGEQPLHRMPHYGDVFRRATEDTVDADRDMAGEITDAGDVAIAQHALA